MVQREMLHARSLMGGIICGGVHVRSLGRKVEVTGVYGHDAVLFDVTRGQHHTMCGSATRLVVSSDDDGFSSLALMCLTCRASKRWKCRACRAMREGGCLVKRRARKRKCCVLEKFWLVCVCCCMLEYIKSFVTSSTRTRTQENNPRGGIYLATFSALLYNSMPTETQWSRRVDVQDLEVAAGNTNKTHTYKNTSINNENIIAIEHES